MKEAEVRFQPTFENGGFWEYYKELERQFDTFLESVPYLKGNKKTYSYQLANLILSLGAHIDSAFKEVAMSERFAEKYPKLRRRAEKGKTTIGEYFPLAESYKLREKAVTFKCLPNGISVTPFKDYIKKNDRVSTPLWWRIYNKVKHQFGDNFEKATLQTTKDALAGAFLLNVVHVDGAMRLAKYGLIRSNFTSERLSRADIDTFKGELERGKKFWCFIETPLFIYNYEA